MPRSYDRSAIPTVHNLDASPAYRDEPGLTQVIFRGIDQMIGFTQITPEKPDGEPHTHPYEQMNILIDGTLEFFVKDEWVELTPYDAITIPPEIPHTARAVPGEHATMFAFWPLREDRLDGVTYQTEFPIEQEL